MTEQFDIFEEIAEQNSVAANDGKTQLAHRRRGNLPRLSPNILRAKVARPAPDSSAAAARIPKALPEPVAAAVPAPAMVVRSKPELIAALRARKEALNISHETIDAIVGWADRYSTKALAPVPRKGMSGDMLQAVLDVLGLGIAAVILTEDPEQAAKMRPRWKARQPFGPRPELVRCSDMQCVAELGPTTTEVS